MLLLQSCGGGSHALIVLDTNVDDAGEYVAVARNCHGTASSSAVLDVTGKPYLLCSVAVLSWKFAGSLLKSVALFLLLKSSKVLYLSPVARFSSLPG